MKFRILNLPQTREILPIFLFAVFSGLLLPGVALAQTLPQIDTHTDSGGSFTNYQSNGPTNEATSPFFQALGSNGRTCQTCHEPGDAFGLSLTDINNIYTATNGTDPLFAAVDGADCIDQPNSHTMLLKHGLIRIMLPISPTTYNGSVPNFTVKVTRDPTKCELSNANVQAACQAEFGPGYQCISLYRRPLPATNVNFLGNLMWDGREPNPITFGLTAALEQQASDAVTEHEQAASPPTSAQLSAIASFEEGLYTTQTSDNNAGSLDGNGATESPQELASQPFSYGLNSTNRPGFNENVFTFFSAWSSLTGTDPVSEAEESIARGETDFNTIVFNDGATKVTCSNCHNDPNVGNNSNNPAKIIHYGTDFAFDPT